MTFIFMFRLQDIYIKTYIRVGRHFDFSRCNGAFNMNNIQNAFVKEICLEPTHNNSYARSEPMFQPSIANAVFYPRLIPRLVSCNRNMARWHYCVSDNLPDPRQSVSSSSSRRDDHRIASKFFFRLHRAWSIRTHLSRDQHGQRHGCSRLQRESNERSDAVTEVDQIGR